MTTPTETPNTGHGHVRPRPDGVKARCGGPGICRVCSVEQAALAQQPSAPSAEPAEIMGMPFKEAKARILALPAEDARGMAISLMIQNSTLLKWEKAFLSQPIDAPQQTAPQAGKAGAFVGVPQVTAAFCSKFPETAALMLNQGAEREYQRLTATPPAAPVPTVQPLSDAQIEEIQKRHNAVYHAGDVFSPQDFARNIELACAAAWGITLAAAPAPTPED